MRIMHLVSVWDGGVKNQVLSISEQMVAQGDQVMVLALRDKSEAKDGEAARVPVVELVRKSTPHEALNAFRRARGLVRSFRPDVVHAHSFHAIIFARLLRLVAKCPYLVSTFHISVNSSNVEEGSTIFTVAYRLTDLLTDINTNVSRESSESFVRSGAVPRNRIVTVFDGIDVEKFSPQPEIKAEMRRQLDLPHNAFVWLAVGRLSAQKDYPTLFAAFVQVAKSAPEALLLVVGDGPLETEFREKISEMGLGYHIRLLGRRTDVPRIMNAADAYVLSSAWEGLPNAAAEAMASGLPTVATDCGGIQELVADCGWVVAARNPEALAFTMIEVSQMAAEQLRAMGMRARARVCESFSLRHCCDDWTALYRARVRKASDWSR